MSRVLFLVFLLLSVSVFSQESYYRSNSIGSMFEKIDPAKKDLEYYLYVNDKFRTIIKILYKDKKEVRKWIIKRNQNAEMLSEDEYINRKITYRRIFEDGNFKKLYFYKNEKIYYIEEYKYSEDKNLIQKIVYDRKSLELYREYYNYSRDGKLRNIIRKDSNGEWGYNKYYYSTGNVIKKEALENEEGSFSSSYDNNARLINNTEIFTDGRKIVTKYHYNDDSRFYDSQTFLETQKGLVLARGEILNDKFGRPVRDILKNKDGKIISDLNYIYRTDEGLELSELLVLKGEDEFRTVFKYRGDKLIKKQIFKNGEILNISYFEGEILEEIYSKVESVFKDAKLVLKIYYGKGNKKMKEEVIQDDKIILTREFK